MAYGDPYCGRCHQWQTRIGQTNIWECTCTENGEAADKTKDPNCHNPGHDHHDPESPIVLAQQAEYAAEKEDGCTCLGGGRFIDYTGPACPVHPIVVEEPVVDGTPFLDTLEEIDEILDDTNEQVEVEEDTECGIFGHVWGKMGKVGLGDQGLSVVDWGPVKCLRCKEPAPLTDDVVIELPPQFIEESVGGPHLCPGCNLRDLTMADAKRHLRHLLVEAPNTKARREAERWLRLDGKIRAWGGD